MGHQCLMRREDRSSISSFTLADLGGKLSGHTVILRSQKVCSPSIHYAGANAASALRTASKLRSLARTAQAIRASLLASAIASTLWWRRFFAASIQDFRPCFSQLTGLTSTTQAACTNSFLR